jgi:prepilin-type N-terminal cleavage/methylation domain-containing protein
MQTKTSQKSGFTLVEIMIVVAIIGLLAAIAIPNFIKAREKSQTSVCISNMKQIEGAVEQWATEAHKKTGDAVPYPGVAGAGIVPDYVKAKPQCPAAALDYAVATVGTIPIVTCPNVATYPLHVLP